MKKLFYISLLAAVGLTATSCWKENMPGAGAARHEVTDLVATPGDEEVQLSWDIPEGWDPTDFIVFYTDASSENVKVRTGGEYTWKVTGLENGRQYTFNVQAVYGKLVSNPVKTSVEPATLRFPVTDLAAAAGDTEVVLSWSKPGTGVLSYTLSYNIEDTPDNVTEVAIDKDAVSHTLSDLTNDRNYYFTLVANYEKGPSEPTTVRAMPNTAIPYTLSREYVAIGQPVEFVFNTTDYPDATNVKWTFPDTSVKEGTTVTGSFTSTGEQTVTLSATVGGAGKTWSVIVNVRQYVVYSTSWAQNGATYNGFKGTAPVFSPDGKTVYIVTFNAVSGLYAFDLETGSEKWRYVPATNSNSYNMLAVNPVTGDIYYGTTTAGQFYAVTSEGQLLWQFTEAGSMQGASPAVNAEGTVVYISDNAGNSFAIDAAAGTKKWSYATGSQSSGLLVNGNDLVIGSRGDIHFVNASDGSFISRFTASAGMVEITGFAVSGDKKTAYFPLKGGAVASLDLETRSLKATLGVGGNDCYEPVVAPNGTVFVGSKDGKVYNLDAALTTVNWSHSHNNAQTNAFNYSHPCIDAGNRFYITSGQTFNTTYIFNSDGTVADSWQYESSDTNQKQMGGNNYFDGVIYSAFIGSATKNGIFVGKYVGGERADSWSAHGGDICGSCCVK